MDVIGVYFKALSLSDTGKRDKISEMITVIQIKIRTHYFRNMWQKYIYGIIGCRIIISCFKKKIPYVSKIKGYLISNSKTQHFCEQQKPLITRYQVLFTTPLKWLLRKGIESRIQTDNRMGWFSMNIQASNAVFFSLNIISLTSPVPLFTL